MADTNISYFNLQLDTTAPQKPTLSLGINGFIASLTGTLGITASSSDTDVTYMKIWGIKGEASKTLIGTDGAKDTWSIDKDATIISITADGNPLSSSDYVYTPESGEILFNTAPTSGSNVVVVYKTILTEETASVENFATTKSIELPSGDGAKTVYAKLYDDVMNASDTATVTVVLDMTPPEVTITTGPTPNKISKVAGKCISQFTFQCSENIVEYFVAVVASSSTTYDVARATQIGTANGSTNMGAVENIAAGISKTCAIYGHDLEAASPGDGTKIVKVFVKDESGNWSV